MAKLKILNSCSGNGFNAYVGQVIELTKANADWLHAKMRHGTAIMLEDEKKKNLDECRGQNEDTNILHDTPTKRKSRKRLDTSEGRGVL